MIQCMTLRSSTTPREDELRVALIREHIRRRKAEELQRVYEGMAMAGGVVMVMMTIVLFYLV